MNKLKTGVVIFGFGSQGRAQAQNLLDSGTNVSVSLRPGSPHIRDVESSGISLFTNAKEAAKSARIAAILVPDGKQPGLWNEIEAHLPKGATIVFAHGFNIHYRQIIPRKDLNIVLVAPLAHADTLRSDFTAGRGTPCLIAVGQNYTGDAKKIAAQYAKGIARDGPFIESTFAEETEVDLFAEQAILCGGLFELIRAGFDTLVRAGCNPDIAYHCCLKEVRPLANLVYENSIAGAREKISDTALYGDLTRGPRIIDTHVRKEMEKILKEIKKGRFMEELLKDRKKGNPLLRRLSKRDKEHLIERIHKKYSKIGK